MRPNKRDEIVQKALDAFSRNGFRATGMDRLVAETGISKTSMYKHFKTKEDLIVAALKLRAEQFNSWAFKRAESLGATPKEQLLAFYDALDEWFNEEAFKSCMFIKASSEYLEPTHAIHRQTVEQRITMLLKLTGLVKAAGLKNPDQIARQLMILQEGAIVTAHFGYSEDPAGDAKEAARVILETAEPVAS